MRSLAALLLLAALVACRAAEVTTPAAAELEGALLGEGADAS